jgi:hypothetical protein
MARRTGDPSAARDAAPPAGQPKPSLPADVLLRTKLHVRAPRPHLLPRAYLLELLAGAPSTRLLLISAPY